MRTRVCPLCDQPMKKAHRCDNCHSFIWKPTYIDIHYNTGGFESEDCSYDAQPHDYEYHDDGSVTMMPSEDSDWDDAPELESEDFKTLYSEATTDGVRRKRKAGSKGRSSKGFRKYIAILATFLIITILPEAIQGIHDFINSKSKPESQARDLDFELEDQNFESDAWDTADMGVTEEYTDEEVLDLGIECTGYTHMEMMWGDFQPVLEDGFGQMELEVTDSLEDSYNYMHSYDGELQYTYYNSSMLYLFESNPDIYCMINWDTVTRKLHEVAFEVSTQEEAVRLFEMVAGALNLWKTDSDKTLNEQIAAAKEEGYVFFNESDKEIYISYGDDSYGGTESYYISITQEF